MMAFAIIVALTLPRVVAAVSIGEVVSQSRLGEPLFAQIDLMAGSGEHIEDSCLSLIAPDPLEENAASYLTQAHLALKTQGGRQYVTIRSFAPFNDAFAKLRLQVKCSGASGITKTLTILPDLDVPVPQAPIASHDAPAVAENTSAPPPSETHGNVPAPIRRDMRDTPPGVRERLVGKAMRPVKKRRPLIARASGKRASSAASFKLEISGEPIDEARIGKLSPKERALLLARQRTLDADDQLVKTMVMQHQLKLLQDALEKVKLQLAEIKLANSRLSELAAIRASALSPATVHPEVPSATEGTAENHSEAANITTPTATPAPPAQPASAVISAKPAARKVVTTQLSLLDEIFARPLFLAGSTVALLGLGAIGFMLLRRRSIAANVGKNGVMVDSTATVIAEPIVPLADEGDITCAATVAEVSLEEQDDIDPIAEAELFLSFGREARAEEWLRDALNQDPDNQQIRLKLLSIYAGRKDAKTFFDLALQVKDSGDAAAWAQTAEMGSTLEPGNPIYCGDGSPPPATGGASLEVAASAPSGLDFDLDFGSPGKSP